MNSSTYRAKKLIHQVASIDKQLSTGESKIPSLVKYKFYDSLIYQILDYYRSVGGPIKETLKELRASLINDYRQESKIQKIRNSSKIQMFITSMIIWSFSFFSLHTLEIDISLIDLAPIFLLQITGIFFEALLLRFSEKRTLSPFEDLSQSIYLFNLLNFSGSSLGDSLNKSNIYFNLEKLPKRFSQFNKDFTLILENWKSFGGSLKEELKFYTEEFHFCFEGELHNYKKTCSAVQFLTMALFFFPCFFILMGIIMHHISLT